MLKCYMELKGTAELPLGLGCIRGRRIWAGVGSCCELTPSPSFPPPTPGMDLRPRKASPSKSSALKVSWSRTVTTRQAPSVLHCSRETRLWYKIKMVKNIINAEKPQTEMCERMSNQSLQFKRLIKKGIEITVFDLSGARFYLREDVVGLETQLHKRIAKTWQKRVEVLGH